MPTNNLGVVYDKREDTLAVSLNGESLVIAHEAWILEFLKRSPGKLAEVTMGRFRVTLSVEDLQVA